MWTNTIAVGSERTRFLSATVLLPALLVDRFDGQPYEIEDSTCLLWTLCLDAV